jgi:lipopolysaccharide heptosyltransferase II
MVVSFLHVLFWPVLTIASLFWPRRKQRNPPEHLRLLLMRVDGIGDLAMSSAIFPSIRRAFPHAKVDLLTSDSAKPLAEMFGAAGWIDTVRSLPLMSTGLAPYFRLAREFRRDGYDAAVDLRGDMRNVIMMWLAGIPRRLGLPGTGFNYLLSEQVDLPDPHHQAEEAAALARRLGVDQIDQWPSIPLQPADLEAADRWMREHQLRRDQPICAMHVGAFFPSKIWPLDRFIAVAQRLGRTITAQFLLVGSERETELAREFMAQVSHKTVSAVGATSLPLTAALLARSSVFIGNDSGPAHVAAGVGCPVVVIFGRGDPQMYRPLSPRVKTMLPSHPCFPGCNKTCTRPAQWCMLDHTADSIAAAAETTFAANGIRPVS